MRSTRSNDVRQRLQDIVENAEFAREVCADLTMEEFALNRGAFYTATRCLEIISEATRKLPTELKERHPEVNWRAAAGAGNVYRHDYPTVEPRQIWTTVRTQVAAMEAAVRAELAALPPADE